MSESNSERGGGPNPFAYVLIPVIGFGLIASLITCFRYRRRKARLARMVADPAYEIQLAEAGRAQLAHQQQHGRGGGGGQVIIVAANGRRTRGGRAGRRLGLGVGEGSREEGLNELGEAPPAYMPSAPKPPSNTGEHVEFPTYSQATAAIGTSRSPPVYGEEPTTTTTTTTGDAMRRSADAGETTAARGTTAAVADTSRGQSPPRYDEEPSTTTRTRTATVTDTTSDASDGTREGTGNTASTTTPANAVPSVSISDEPTAPPRAMLPRS